MPTAAPIPEPPRRGPSLAAVALATVAGNVCLLALSFVFSVLAILVSWIPPNGRPFFAVIRLWARLVLWTSGVRLRVRFEAPLAGQRCVFMANHQSLYDIPALLASLPVQSRFLAKRTLFLIPFFGWGLKAGGFVTIDRKDKSRVGESFAAAIRQIEKVGSVLVFPEGTRSRDGRIGEFKRGGLLLALKAGLPIVPVGLRGSFEVRSRRRLTIRPGTIEVRYGAPIDVAEFGIRGRDELGGRVRAEVARLAGAALAGDAG